MKRSILITALLIMPALIAGCQKEIKPVVQEPVKKEMAPPVETASIATESVKLPETPPPPEREEEPRERYVGVTAFSTPNSCLPDGCDDQCRQACSGVLGEECHSAIDVLESCLNAYPPQEAPGSVAAMHAAMVSCVEKHAKEYNEKYRCRFSTSVLDHRLYTGADPEGKCREIFGDYQSCLKAQAPKGGLSVSVWRKMLKSCQERFNADFNSNECALYTEQNVRRLYGRTDPNTVNCYAQCL